MPALNGVEYGSQDEECREGGRKPGQQEILHKVREAALEVRHPPGTDASTGQRRRYSERREPTDELWQSEKHDRPEHPLRKVPANQGVRDGALPQAETRQHQADDGGRGRKQQHQSHEIRNQLWRGHSRYLSKRNRQTPPGLLSRACLSVGLSDSGGALGNPVFEQSGHA